jgi:beta-lactam-binding protein with PASTA domain
MPDLTGLSVASAQAQLSRVGIKLAVTKFVDVPVGSVGTGNAAPAPPVRPGAITAQQPPAGVRVEQSVQVTLTAAR